MVRERVANDSLRDTDGLLISPALPSSSGAGQPRTGVRTDGQARWFLRAPAGRSPLNLGAAARVSSGLGRRAVLGTERCVRSRSCPSQVPGPGALALSRGRSSRPSRGITKAAGALASGEGTDDGGVSHIDHGLRRSEVSVSRTQPEHRVATRTGCAKLPAWAATAMPQGAAERPSAGPQGQCRNRDADTSNGCSPGRVRWQEGWNAP